MNSETAFVYQAKVGALGEVTFWKDHPSKTYCFTFFNGDQYTPLFLSEDAAYFTWLFIGCEHPNIPSDKKYQVRKTQVNNFTTAKKAGCGKPKKQPSKPTKKKAKSK